VTLQQRIALAVLSAIAACSAGGVSAGVPAVAPDALAKRTPIVHVVYIIQENRSFNDLFMGFPGAKTATYGYNERHRKITLHSQGLATAWDLGHTSQAFFTDCDGAGSLPGTKCRMDGWNHEQAELGHPKDFAYAYVPQDEIKPYWQIAKQYVLADRMFTSELDGSFVAHQYAVAAYASRSVDNALTDWGCEGGTRDTIATLTRLRSLGPRIRVCFNNETLGSEADNAGVTWRYYTGDLKGSGAFWSAYQADRRIFRGPDWKADVVTPPAQFLADVADGKLASITWVTPTFATSDHPGLLGQSSQGPAWVASVVDAIGESKFWKSTAIFVQWDDWGGWFDPVQPVYEDYDGLGFRVPLLMISPYAKRGYVTHVQYETASVLRYIEDNFGLPQLAPSDQRANDPAADAFDYNQQPRAFKKIRGAKPPSYWAQLERYPESPALRESILGDD
jgi:phospholipase C